MTPRRLALQLVKNKIEEQIKNLFNDEYLAEYYTTDELRFCNDELINIAIKIQRELNSEESLRKRKLKRV